MALIQKVKCWLRGADRGMLASMRETPLFALLLCYAACAFTYSLLCGSMRASPLAAFQVYAVGIPIWYCVGAAIYVAHATRKARPLPRFWPPTRQEALAAFSSTLMLTSETLMLLMPQSIFAVIAGKAGCLAFPDPTDKRPLGKRLRLAAVVIVAVILAAVGRHVALLALPILLACLYVVGQRLKLRAVRLAKDDDAAKPGFFAAGQVLVIALTLCVAVVFHQASEAKLDFGDARLWLVALASLGAGLLGLRITLQRTAESVVFPAYRACSLLCALGATAARGEALHWSGWLAVALALGVVLWASGEAPLRRCWAWLRVAFGVAMMELGAGRPALNL